MTKKIVKNVLAFCLGIFITLLFVEIFLRGLGWYQNNKNLFTEITVKNKNEIRILSLGDSMTAAGEKPFYPEQIQNILSTSLLDKKVIVFNAGVPSFTSKNILFNLEKNLKKYQPDIVTIMIGVSDWGSVKYEEFAGIKSTDFLSNLKTYKLYKFLLKNIQDRLIKTSIIIQDRLIKTAFAITNDTDLVKLGEDSFRYGQINMAKDYFEKALRINPNNDQAYFGLGMVFNFNGERDKGKIYFEKAVTINPNNSEAYIQLGQTRSNNKSFESLDKDIWYLQQAIKINPNNPEAYLQLAIIYDFLHMDKQLLITLNQGLRIDPHSYHLLMFLAKYYVEKNNVTEAIIIINKAFDSQFNIRPSDIQLLVELYKSQGKTKEAKDTLDLLKKSSGELTQNYIKIADILKKRGIILIAIQYPMRDISPLKTILKDTDTIFVDNEKSFKEQVTKYGPEKYFLDRFAGDFGHLTAKGHRIVAENIANAILKQIFKIKKE